MVRAEDPEDGRRFEKSGDFPAREAENMVRVFNRRLSEIRGTAYAAGDQTRKLSP